MGLCFRDQARYHTYPFVHDGRKYNLEVNIDGFFESFSVYDENNHHVLYYNTESELDEEPDYECDFSEDSDNFYLGVFVIPKK